MFWGKFPQPILQTLLSLRNSGEFEDLNLREESLYVLHRGFSALMNPSRDSLTAFFAQWKVLGCNGFVDLLPTTVVNHIIEYCVDSTSTPEARARHVFWKICDGASVAGFILWAYLNLPDLSDEWDDQLIRLCFKLRMTGSLNEDETKVLVDTINTVNTLVSDLNKIKIYAGSLLSLRPLRYKDDIFIGIPRE